MAWRRCWVFFSISSSAGRGRPLWISDLPRNATIRAATAVDAIAVSREAFRELLGHLPGLSETMEKIMEVRMERNVNLKEEMPAAKPAAGARRGKA